MIAQIIAHLVVTSEGMHYEPKSLEFWAPMIFAVPLTVICLIIGFAGVGVGHGDALPLVLLFPYFSLFLSLGEVLGLEGILPGLLALFALIFQFPLYGLCFSIGVERGKLPLMLSILVVMHMLVAAYPAYNIIQ